MKIRLLTDDTLFGTLASATADEVTLVHPVLGRITLGRADIESMTLNSARRASPQPVVLPGAMPVQARQVDVAVIPVRGSLGCDGSPEWVDARAFHAVLQQAKALDPRFIVLEMDSHSGRMSTALLMIDALLRELPRGRAPTLVAWPEAAKGPAALLALSCPRIVAKQLTAIGPGAARASPPAGWSAIEDIPPGAPGHDARIASLATAKSRLAMEYAERPMALPEAVLEPKASLYWSASERKLVAQLPNPKSPGDFVRIDGPDDCLMLTAQSAVDFGIASATAYDDDELRAALGLSKDATLVRLGAELPAWRAAVNRQLQAMSQARDPATVRQEVNVYRSSVLEAAASEEQARDLDDTRQGLRGDPKTAAQLRQQADSIRKRQEAARKAAGAAKLALQEIEVAARAATRALAELGGLADLKPSSASLIEALAASFKQFESNNVRGASNALPPP